MFKKPLIVIALFVVGLPAVAFAQNSNSSTVRPRTAAPAGQNTNRSTTDAETKADTPRSVITAPQKKVAPEPAKPKAAAPQDPASQSVAAAFNALINGIRESDLNAITSAYWNSPRLVLFNNNGTVTKGWEQMRKNRESSIKDVKNVKLEVRDVSITMLGRDGAVVNALWTQSQDYKGQPETATGRMTIVFRRIGTAWKAIHLHTSPDRPDPSRVMPSEQTATPTPNP